MASRRKQVANGYNEMYLSEPDEQQQNQYQPPKGSNSLKIKLDQLIPIEPLTQNQHKFFSEYDLGNYAIVMYGSAGTGKTFLAFYKAIQEVLSKDTPYRKVVIVRSAVATRSVGFLKGDLDSKLSLFEEPYMDIFAELFGRPDAYQRLKEQGYVEFVSTSFLRGRTFNDCILVFDEYQNTNWQEGKSVLSRVGSRSKIILCGDYAQTDLSMTSKSDSSGFANLMKVASITKDFVFIKMTTEDIVRSSFCKNFLIACEQLGI